MFRKYYEERGMTDPRDSWYKPNMLYNIHLKPPTPKDPPRFEVVTKKFNPSVCTCGEHGCVPQYRMEREVVWLKKDIEIEEDKGRNVKESIQGKDEVSTEGEMSKESGDRLANDTSRDIQLSDDGRVHVELSETDDDEEGVKANYDGDDDDEDVVDDCGEVLEFWPFSVTASCTLHGPGS